MDVRLTDQAGTIVLELCADGHGGAPTCAGPGHRGLRALQERTAQLGGTLQIESAPGHGTCVCAAIPYAAEHAPS